MPPKVQLRFVAQLKPSTLALQVKGDVFDAFQEFQAGDSKTGINSSNENQRAAIRFDKTRERWPFSGSQIFLPSQIRGEEQMTFGERFQQLDRPGLHAMTLAIAFDHEV